VAACGGMADARVDLAALGDDAIGFFRDADREVIFTMRCGRRSSCGRRQPYPTIATGAPLPVPGCSELSQRGLLTCLVGCR
jgi:hypothetical protein